MNFFKKAWEMVSPLIVYGLIQYTVAAAAFFLWLYSKGNPGLGENPAEMLNQNVVLISGISALLSIPVLKHMLHKEWLKRPYVIQQNEPKAEKYMFVLIASAGATVSVNLFINALGIFKYATDYARAAREMYGEPLYMQIMVIGILMPVMEELIFRGLIYERVSNFSGEASGILLMSVIFGIYHGNLLQGIYAFCFSLLLIYVYKRTGSFAASICFHSASNLICLVLNRMAPLSTMGYSVGIVLSAMIGIYGLRELNRKPFFKVIPIDIEGEPENSGSGDVSSGEKTEKDWD